MNGETEQNKAFEEAMHEFCMRILKALFTYRKIPLF